MVILYCVQMTETCSELIIYHQHPGASTCSTWALVNLSEEKQEKKRQNQSHFQGFNFYSLRANPPIFSWLLFSLFSPARLVSSGWGWSAVVWSVGVSWVPDPNTVSSFLRVLSSRYSRCPTINTINRIQKLLITLNSSSQRDLHRPASRLRLLEFLCDILTFKQCVANSTLI